MDVRDHFRITSGALQRWFVAQSYDALAVAALWLVGLLIIRVPWAPFWALLAGALQFIPNFGPVLGLIGPALAAMIKGGWESSLYVLILYAVVVVVDGLVLQPVLMKKGRAGTRIEVLASAATAASLENAILHATTSIGVRHSVTRRRAPFWGVLISPPLLAVLYAYKARSKDPVRPQ